MGRQVLSAEDRKQRLNEARVALRFGGRTAWVNALNRLPVTGEKAAELRQHLIARLADDDPSLHGIAPESVPHSTEPSRSVNNTTQSRSVQTLRVTCDLHFRFELGELDSSAFFQVQMRGNEALVLLNTYHPFVLQVVSEGKLDGEPIVHPVIRRLLVAWARLELEGPPGIQRERLQQVREDLGRLVREDQLSSSESPRRLPPPDT